MTARWLHLGVAVVVSLVCASSCVESSATQCSGGGVCPTGMVCDEAHHGCATMAQIASCAGKNQLDACDYPGVPDAACYEGVCLPGGCGNGLLEGTEVCDDGNHLHGDGCSADCRSDETCGNGVVDVVAGEACDDGNLVDGDGCQADCHSARCGDGVVDVAFGETCDLGSANSDVPDALCRMNCQPARCGDAVVDAQELCDDGNVLSGDGCSFDCRSNETCGNGITDYVTLELCDDGNALSHDGCSSCRSENATWTQVGPGSPVNRVGGAMAYDAARGRVVVFGGYNGTVGLLDDTWEWDGTAWTDVTPRTLRPSARSHATLTYDAARARIVMFGGDSGVAYLGDTWEWNGEAWTDVTPSTGNPPPRSRHAAAYDAARKRIVMFGGYDGVANRSDTWEWNGSAWANVTPATGNVGMRSGHAMTYDPVRGRVLLFGGEVTPGSNRADTWTWNGTAWTEVTPASGNPSARVYHAMAYDARRDRVVLFSGTNVADTWEWNGSMWADVTPASGNPSARAQDVMAYDLARGRTVMFGGSFTAESPWEWNGASWSAITPATAAPSARSGHAVAYDTSRGRTVLFGGQTPAYLQDTWEWNGTSWADRTPAGTKPSARFLTAMAYDAARARVVLFGGLTTGGASAETWEWDGASWSDVSPGTGNPDARYAHAMAYDTIRARVVMFGGRDAGGGLLDHTWEWNGSQWSDVTPGGTNPPPRAYHAMAFDVGRQRVVMFGGAENSISTFVNSMWEWTGTAWSMVPAASNAPSRRVSPSMSYDRVAARIVVFSGRNDTAANIDDTWTWNGIVWSNITPALGNPPPRDRGAMVYDPVHQESVLFGGSDSSQLSDTWTFRYDARSDTIESCQYGVDTDGDGKLGCADPDCAGCCSQCGDGVCQGTEGQRLCPADCGTPAAACGDFLCDPSETAASCPGDC